MRYDSAFSLKVITVFLLGTMASMSCLLVYSHGKLRQQMNRVMELQEEYHTYTVAFQKAIPEFARSRTPDELVPFIASDDEKKKEQPFLVVNREPAYLKESLEEYIRERNLGNLLVHLDAQNKKTSSRKRRSISKQHGSLLSRQLRSKKHTKQPRDIELSWPLDRSRFWISSFYGARRNPNRSWGFHYGIDMAAMKGTPVYAARSGVVIEAGVNKGYGKTVVVAHNKKYKTRYAHLHSITCRVGDRVQQGQTLGLVGDTGLVRKSGRLADHLHFEVYAHGKQVNPLHYLA
ncbi:M23 family metallopeptidase [Candidatus Babeliales bacterium]|nr:M23 family metallopeptidase [Candidatus Babeliales bacterium]